MNANRAIEMGRYAKTCGGCPHHLGAMLCEITGERVPLLNPSWKCPVGRWDDVEIPAPILLTPRRRMNPANFARGAIKLVFWATRVCRSSAVIVRHRAKMCDACPRRRSVLGLKFCSECKCWIRAKIGLPAEKCPIWRWGADSAGVKRCVKLPVIGPRLGYKTCGGCP